MQIDLQIISDNIEFQKEYWLQMEQCTDSIAYYSIEAKDWQTQLQQDVTEHSVLVLCLSGESLTWEWVSKVKQIKDVPLLVLSEKENYYEEIQCLRNGADDYQSNRKPVAILQERMLRMLEKKECFSDSVLMMAGLTEEVSGNQFFYNGVSLGLTSKEYQVLYWLLHSPEAVVSRQKLLFHVWQKEKQDESRVLDTIVKQLRKKLSVTNIEIKTCYGKGFQIIKKNEK